MLLISACLLGAKVKYNGSSNYCTLLAKYKDCGLLYRSVQNAWDSLLYHVYQQKLQAVMAATFLTALLKYTTMLAIMLQKILSKVLKLFWKSPAENK